MWRHSGLIRLFQSQMRFRKGAVNIIEESRKSSTRRLIGIIGKSSKLKVKSYLVVSRLESYKRIDLAIEFFNTRKDQLVIVGTGSQKSKLQKIAGKNIQFLENLTDSELANLYIHAQALIMPQEEDFGYVALEAQFFGCPVIAYAQGGACETVKDGVTGVLFYKQEKTALHHAIARFHTLAYNLKSNLAKKNDIFDKFAKERFKKLFLL